MSNTWHSQTLSPVAQYLKLWAIWVWRKCIFVYIHIQYLLPNTESIHSGLGNMSATLCCSLSLVLPCFWQLVREENKRRDNCIYYYFLLHSVWWSAYTQRWNLPGTLHLHRYQFPKGQILTDLQTNPSVLYFRFLHPPTRFWCAVYLNLKNPPVRSPQTCVSRILQTGVWLNVLGDCDRRQSDIKNHN